VFFLFIATDYPYFLELFGVLMIDLSGSSRPIDWSTNNTTPEDFYAMRSETTVPTDPPHRISASSGSEELLRQE